MGCFSYICPKCGNPIYADRYGNCIGEEVRLARLVKGKVVEWMRGRYDSYGKVHIPAGDGFKSEHFIIADSGQLIQIYDEKMKHNWLTSTWNNIVNEQFSNDKSEGLIAIHEKCWNSDWGNVQSKDDPDQGWNDYENPDDEEE